MQPKEVSRKSGSLRALIALFVAAFLFSLPASAAENPYDILGKALMPLANLFLTSPKPPNKAVSMQLSIEKATDLPPEAAGRTVDIRLQNPDKLVVRCNILAEPITVGRNGQKIWATPGTMIEGLIATQDLPPADPGFKLGPLQLPVSEKQLVFLPVLFKVTDAGSYAADGVDCHVLDVSLMPEIAHSLKLEGWVARLWVRPDYKPARIEFFHDKWRAVIGVKKLVYSPSLPPETWEPTASDAQDVLQLTPPRYKQLIEISTQLFTNYKR